jgi:hypothetical protein
MQLITLALMFLGINIAANKPDFSGLWIMNTAKGNFEDLDALEGDILKAEQDGDHLTAIEISTSKRGKALFKRDYTLEGRVGKAILLRSGLRREAWVLSKVVTNLQYRETWLVAMIRFG